MIFLWWDALTFFIFEGGFTLLSLRFSSLSWTFLCQNYTNKSCKAREIAVKNYQTLMMKKTKIIVEREQRDFDQYFAYFLAFFGEIRIILSFRGINTLFLCTLLGNPRFCVKSTRQQNQHEPWQYSRHRQPHPTLTTLGALTPPLPSLIQHPMRP